MASVKTKTDCILWWVGREIFIKATEHLKSQFNSLETPMQTIEIFSKLSEYEKCMVRMMGPVKKFDDTYLFKEGEVLTHFYILISGTVCLSFILFCFVSFIFYLLYFIYYFFC